MIAESRANIGDMDFQTLNITDVHPHPLNVREGDIGAIIESLKSHGQYRPIVVQKSTGLILAGNHTWKAANTLGWKTIDVVEVDVDDDEAVRILLVDNRTNDLATYDKFGLADLLSTLSKTEQSLAGTGFSGDDLDDLMKDIMEDPMEMPELDTSEQMSGLSYRIVIDCANEFEQESLLSQFAEQGLNAKALVS